jgi:hypothetical protein
MEKEKKHENELDKEKKRGITTKKKDTETK